MKNEPAFPINFQYANSGLTKLEYFAAMALQGLLSNSSIDLGGKNGGILIQDSFNVAEAMLKESKKRGK